MVNREVKNFCFSQRLFYYVKSALIHYVVLIDFELSSVVGRT